MRRARAWGESRQTGAGASGKILRVGTNRNAAAVPATLGSVLYAKPRKGLETERDWVALVRAVARGDQTALHALFERTYRPVFTLIMRLRPDRETAEALTLDVFVEIWRRALVYDPAQGTVLAWIMNLARARAIATELGPMAPVERTPARGAGRVAAGRALRDRGCIFRRAHARRSGRAAATSRSAESRR